MRLDDSTLVTLGHGVHVVTRGDTAVQFGLDATRSGIVDTRVAPALAMSLRSTKWPLTIKQLQDQLVGECSVDSTAARSLIDDLCAYNILIPSARTTVALLGATPLAQEIRRVLEASGASVRIRLAGEDTRSFLNRMAGAPLIVVDGGGEYVKWSRPLKEHRNWVVPVLSFDSRVIIGPVARHPSHACGMCAHMHVSDRDDQFRAAADQLEIQPRTIDPVIAAAGAAAAALTVRRLAGIPDPPGIVGEMPSAGWAAVVDPLGAQTVSLLDMEQHPRCPVCISVGS